MYEELKYLISSEDGEKFIQYGWASFVKDGELEWRLKIIQALTILYFGSILVKTENGVGKGRGVQFELYSLVFIITMSHAQLEYRGHIYEQLYIYILGTLCLGVINYLNIY